MATYQQLLDTYLQAENISSFARWQSESEKLAAMRIAWRNADDREPDAMERWAAEQRSNAQ